MIALHSQCLSWSLVVLRITTREELPVPSSVMRADTEKAHSSLQARIKLLENHAGQGTTPSGLRIKRIQVRGQNVDTLQGKFDDIIREALKRSC